MSEIRQFPGNAERQGGAPAAIEPRPFHVFTERQFDQIEALKRLPDDYRFAMRVVAKVLPFRVNDYVINDLIDWDQAPDDPIFRLVFPQPGMLLPAHFEKIADLVTTGASRQAIAAAAHEIHLQLNPHPAEQRTLNVPRLGDTRLEGLQHKYRETVLLFPSQGQTCHSYCTFCFRWPQFVGSDELRISAHESANLRAYLKAHTEVTDLLVTGGDPMVMRTRHLAEYLEPLMQPDFDHVQTIRIGSKALTYWPYRFVTDADADDLLRLIERLVAAGKHVAFMAHFNHWREMETPVVHEAVRRLRNAGAVIRTQAPLLRHINADPAVWQRLWTEQVRLGMVPYYMFVVRDTGARYYFDVPLAEALRIYQQAFTRVSGLARTARGPSMSAGPGKVEVQGVTEIGGEKVFALRFIQGRNPDWVGKPFFARYDPKATWLDQLKPAFGAEKFFFEDEYEGMRAAALRKQG